MYRCRECNAVRMFCLPFLGPLHNGQSLKQEPMHFWIDKRSQECTYNGRHRVPASLSAAGRRRRLSKPMVTPVHRFQPIENRTGPPLRRQPTNQNARTSSQPCIAPSISYTASPPVPSDPPPPPPLDSSLYLDNATLDNSARPKRGSCTYCVFVIFGAGIFGIIAKFINGPQTGGINVSIEGSIVVVSLMISCLLSCCKKAPSNNSSAQSNEIINTDLEVATFSNLEMHNQVISNPNPSVAATSVTVETELPPPPYHLAILLPPQETAPDVLNHVMDEVPPPTYENAIIR